MMAPECPFEKASGLIMVKVRLLIYSFLFWLANVGISAELCTFATILKPISEIFPLLEHPRRVVVIMHQKPDADAMGSSLGLSLFLRKLGHHTTVISPTNWAEWLKWMPSCDAVIDYEFSTEKAIAALDQAEWIFCLDFNTLTRTRHMAARLRKLPAQKILIDHHQQPEAPVFA